MTSIAKLKDRARKHEQREDWKAAIEAYQRVLEAEEGQDELELELGLFNRVGDLYLRLGQTDEAVAYYEKAADKYAESGFYNNAIALCNKALRHRPDRPETYLKLSRLCIEQGFVPDARRWILEFAERQVRAGRVDEALAGLEDFADTTDDPDVRELLARHLTKHDRSEDAVAQLRSAYRSHREQGNDAAAERVAERARELDPDVDLGEAEGAAEDAVDFASGVVPRPTPSESLGLETHRYDEREPLEAESLDALEIGRRGEAEAPEASDSLGGLETFSPAEDEEDAEPLPLLDTGYEDEAGEPAAAEAELGEEPAAEPVDEPEEEEAVDAPEEEAEPFPVLGTTGGEEQAGEPWPEDGPEEEAPAPEHAEERAVSPFAGLAEEGEPAVREEVTDADDPLAAAKKYGIEPVDLDSMELSFGPSSTGLEDTPRSRDVDVATVLNRARELVARALTSEALKELRLLSGVEAPASVFRDALGVANEIVRHDANDVGALQARVEFAAAAQDEDLLVGAYLDLGDALARLGSETKARAMYERVLDLEPGNEAAREALGAPAGDEDDAVDLDAILREMEPEEGSGAAPPEPSDPALAAALSQLRSRTESGEGDDAGDHYDLGLAFKEMGLIDEAIAEFQTALTAGEEGLKVYEELGRCFVLKRQYTVALKIFRRALQMPHEDETELLGVYYLLGQCHEELGQREEAREAYEKVLSIDDSFADVPTRVARL